MKNAIIPKFLFDDEDVYSLQDKGIQVDEGTQTIGRYKVPCYRFINMNESEVFDELEGNALLEANAQDNAFAGRASSILFLKLREAMQIKEKEQRIAAGCALLAAVNSLAAINTAYAKRFLPLVRTLN